MTDQSVPSDPTKLLNLVRGSPSFVLLEDRMGRMTVSNPATIPPADGLCWVGAVLITPGAGTYDAVLIVDTGAGGELCGGYIWDGEWVSLDELLSHVGAHRRGDVFPFDYSFKVPLEVDMFH